MSHIRFMNRQEAGQVRDTEQWTIDHITCIAAVQANACLHCGRRELCGRGGFDVGRLYGEWVIKFLVRIRPQIPI